MYNFTLQQNMKIIWNISEIKVMDYAVGQVNRSNQEMANWNLEKCVTED